MRLRRVCGWVFIRIDDRLIRFNLPLKVGQGRGMICLADPDSPRYPDASVAVRCPGEIASEHTMSRKIRVGVIGFGRMGRGFVSAMQADDRWDIVNYIRYLNDPTRFAAAGGTAQ